MNCCCNCKLLGFFSIQKAKFNTQTEVEVIWSVVKCRSSGNNSVFFFLTCVSVLSDTESTLATGLINALTPDVKKLLPSCPTSRSVLLSNASHLNLPRYVWKISSNLVVFCCNLRCFTLTHAFFFFFLPFSRSPIRGSTIKTSRTNVPTATVPTQTRRRCRSTCQRTPSKTQRPTAVACVAGRTPQWVNHTQKKNFFRRLRDCDLCSVSFREFAIRWWPLMILRSECSLVSCLWYSAAQLSRQS